MIRKTGSLAGGAGAMLLLLATAEPTSAQAWKFDVGAFGGGSWFSTMLSEEHIAGGTGDESIRYEPGWLLGGQATFWLNPRLGLRADLAYSERSLQDANDPLDPDREIAEDINLWGISGDVMIRLRQPNDRWSGSEFLPYIALGAGIQRTNPADKATVTGANETEDGLIFGVGTSDFLLAEDNALMGLIGLGADWRLGPNFAVRLELNDRIYDPRIFLLEDTGAGDFTFAQPDEDIGKVTHWVSGQVGLHLLLGLQAPRQLVVAPPPPTPPAAPAPPPPPPAAEAVTVCVVDPSAPHGLRMVNAFYRPAAGDTVVVEAGDTLAFARTLAGDVRLAPSATWYTTGQPLVFEFRTAPRRAEFLTIGSSRAVGASELTYLGRTGGIPVYAARADVAAVRTDWTAALDASTDDDLQTILQGNPRLRTAFNDVAVLYVPVEPYGCVFQALERQEEVRKGGR